MKFLKCFYKLCLLFLLLLLSSNSLYSQRLTGYVLSSEGDTLIGATVLWKGTKTGAVTDNNGFFEISRPTTTATLSINYVGYEPVFVDITPEEDFVLIQISGLQQLDIVEINAKNRSNYISTLDPRGVQTISTAELRKAPCCNLSESFETSGTVDVVYTDAITGAKEIQMLGLRGLYSQMLVESRPSLNGLSTPFSLEYIPGTWLSGIMINKGTGSVINGYQSISGQINADLVKPHQDKKFFVNLYGEPQGRGEINLHLNRKLSKAWSTGLLLHGNILRNQVDHDHNDFIDMPLKRQLNGLYRLFYESEAVCSQVNVNLITEQREGGQVMPLGADPAAYFRTLQRTDRVEIYGKTGFKGFSVPYKSLGSQYSFTYHRTNARYGNHTFNGEQRQFYLNLLYSTIINTSDHKLTTGTSFTYDDIRQYLDDTDFSYTEKVPGAFAEYTYDRLSPKGYTNFNIIAGLRADYFNFEKMLITPRINLKYNFSENTALRFNAGKGYRTANVIVENMALLANNKAFIVTEPLEMEAAVNMGFNLTHHFNILGREAELNVDLYRTQFQNKVILDVDKEVTEVLIYNLDGRSIANSLLVTAQWEVLQNLDLKLAYKINDVKVDYLEGFRSPPMVPRHRALATIFYETPAKKWRFNVTSQYIGPQRLPDHDQLPPQYSQHLYDVSPSYVLLNAQVNRTFGRLEIYAGGENLTGYVQHHPIIAAENPWSPYFDGSQIYAPTNNQRVYLGLKWWIE